MYSRLAGTLSQAPSVHATIAIYMVCCIIVPIAVLGTLSTRGEYTILLIKTICTACHATIWL